LFWQRADRFFARRMEQDQWDKFIAAAKIKKAFW
jgi:hypothetical protein